MSVSLTADLSTWLPANTTPVERSEPGTTLTLTGEVYFAVDTAKPREIERSDIRLGQNSIAGQCGYGP